MPVVPEVKQLPVVTRKPHFDYPPPTAGRPPPPPYHHHHHHHHHHPQSGHDSGTPAAPPSFPPKQYHDAREYGHGEPQSGFQSTTTPPPPPPPPYSRGAPHPDPHPATEGYGEPQSGYLSTTPRPPKRVDTVMSTSWRPPKRHGSKEEDRSPSAGYGAPQSGYDGGSGIAATATTTTRKPRRTSKEPRYGPPTTATTSSPYKSLVGGHGITPQSGHSPTTAAPPHTEGYGTPQSGYSTTGRPPPYDHRHPASRLPPLLPEHHGRDSPWYQPPPISPDLPMMLFYEDAPRLKETPLKVDPTHEEAQSETPPVVKSLGYHNFSPPHHREPHGNVIHFGTDFGPRHVHEHLNAIHDSLTELPAEVKSLHPSGYATTTAPPAHYPARSTPYHLYPTSIRPGYEQPTRQPPRHEKKSPFERLMPDRRYPEHPTNRYRSTPPPPPPYKEQQQQLPTPTQNPTHQIKHLGTPRPDPKAPPPVPVAELPKPPEETSSRPRLIPLPTPVPEGFPSGGTTSPAPYRHWTSPDEIFFKPTSGSYVRIQYSPSRDSRGEVPPVKTLVPTTPAIKTATKAPSRHEAYEPAKRPLYHLPVAEHHPGSTPVPPYSPQKKPRHHHQATVNRPKPDSRPPRKQDYQEEPVSRSKPEYHARPALHDHGSAENPEHNYVGAKPAHRPANPKTVYHSTPQPDYHPSAEPPKPQYHPTHRPDYHPKPTYHPAPEPGYQPSLKPVHHSTPKPQYHPGPTYHSTPKSAYKQKQTYHSTPKPAYHSTPKPDYHPKPAYHSTPTPAYHSSPKPAHHSSPKPAYHSSPKPAHRSTPRPDHESKPAYHSSREPVHHSTPKPDHQPSSKPAHHATRRPDYHPSPVSGYHPTPEPGYYAAGPPEHPVPKANKRPQPKSLYYSTPKPISDDGDKEEPSGYYSSPSPRGRHHHHHLTPTLRPRYPPTPTPTRQLPTGGSPFYHYTNVYNRPPLPTHRPHPYHHVSTMGPLRELREEFPVATPTPTGLLHPPAESHRSSYAPSPHLSHVKSLPYTHHHYQKTLYFEGGPTPTPSFYHHPGAAGSGGRRSPEDFPIGVFPADIPLHVDHFPTHIVPTATARAKAPTVNKQYYMSPRPVYLPGIKTSLLK